MLLCKIDQKRNPEAVILDVLIVYFNPKVSFFSCLATLALQKFLKYGKVAI